MVPGLPDQNEPKGAHVIPFPRAPRLERARGSARLALSRNETGTGVSDLYQSGCAKLLLPQTAPGALREAVLINTAGGLTDGDRLSQEVLWHEGAEGLVTTQAAERIYRSRHAPAEIHTRLSVGAEALAFWLPQETILFNGARLTRKTEVEVDPKGRLIACESLIFGRTAMGEEVTEGSITDSWRIRSSGRLIFADTFRLEEEIAETLKRPAVAKGAKALATLLYVGPDAEEKLQPFRELAAGQERSASSCLKGLVVTRVLADSGAELRQSLVALLAVLLDGPDRLPRVWSC